MPCSVRLKFGQLFGASIAVGMSFTVLLTILGAIAAVVAPEYFPLSDEHVKDPVQTLLALAIVFAIGAGVTAVVAFVGTIGWMIFRRILPARSVL